MAGFLGFGTYNAPQATVDPNFQGLVDQQNANSAAFTANAPNLQQQQGVQASEDTRQGLANRMANIKSSSSKRGLLYSGLKQSQEAGSQQQAGSQLAGQQANINNAVQNQQQGLQQQAIQSGMAMQQAQQAANEANYQNAVQQRQERLNAVSGLMGGIGGIIGKAG